MDAKQGWSDPQNSNAENPHENPSLWAIAWHQKWIILIIMTLGGGLGYLYFLRWPPAYRSSAQILIVKRDVAIPVQGATDDRSSYDSTFNVHSLLLRSPTIAAKALENHGLRSLPTFAKSQDPLAAIAGGLTVDCKGGGSTSVATLTFKCGSREDCPKVLDGLIKAYQEFLGETYQNSSEETGQVDLPGQGRAAQATTGEGRDLQHLPPAGAAALEGRCRGEPPRVADGRGREQSFAASRRAVADAVQDRQHPELAQARKARRRPAHDHRLDVGLLGDGHRLGQDQRQRSLRDAGPQDRGRGHRLRRHAGRKAAAGGVGARSPQGQGPADQARPDSQAAGQ